MNSALSNPLPDCAHVWEKQPIELPDGYLAVPETWHEVLLSGPDGTPLLHWQVPWWTDARLAWSAFIKRQGRDGDLAAALQHLRSEQAEDWLRLCHEQIDSKAITSSNFHCGVRLQLAWHTPAGPAPYRSAELRHRADPDRKGRAWRTDLHWHVNNNLEDARGLPHLIRIECEYYDAWSRDGEGCYNVLDEFDDWPEVAALSEEFAKWCGQLVDREMDMLETARSVSKSFADFPWDDWHLQQLQLAARLKAVLGDEYTVVCERHVFDPQFKQDYRRIIVPGCPPTRVWSQ